MFCAPKYFDNSNGIGGSNLSVLDYMYVLKGLKRCSINFIKDKITPLYNFCKVHKLYFELSDFKVLSNSEKNKGGFSNSSSRVSIDSPNGNYVVFLSKNQIDAKLAKNYFATSDHRKLGQLLGYPDCCTEFFSKNIRLAAKKNMDFIPYALSDIQQHDFYNNRALRYFDISLISHFPCSLDCKASQAVAKERLAFLRKEHPQIAALFEKYLKSMVIYTEEEGIFFSNNYSINHNQISFENLQGTIENDLYYKLKNAGEFTVMAFNGLQIGPKLLEDDVYILLFK